MKRRSGLALSFAAIVLAAACQKPTADEHFQRANTILVEEALKLQPQSPTPHLALAALHLRDGSVDKAEAHSKLAIGLEPDLPAARALQVRLLLTKGETAAAGTLLASLQREFAASPPILKLAGDLQMADGKLAAARASYSALLAASPGDIDAMKGIVRIDLATGHAPDALRRVDAILKATTPSADSLVLAARTYRAAGQVARAAELLRRATEVAPARPEAYELLGRIYAAQGRVDEGTTQYQQLVRRIPTSIAANTMLAILLEAGQRLPEAEKQYQLTLGLDSRAPVAANNLAWMFVAGHRNLDEALQLAQTAQQQFPDEPHFNDTLGWIYYRKNMLSFAVRHLELSVARDATDSGSQFHLGMAHFESGDWVKAKRGLQSALSLNPDFDGAEQARKTLAQIG